MVDPPTLVWAAMSIGSFEICGRIVRSCMILVPENEIFEFYNFLGIFLRLSFVSIEIASNDLKLAAFIRKLRINQLKQLVPHYSHLK